MPARAVQDAGATTPGVVAQRKASQSSQPESNTRPGSAALFGATWPAPCRKIRTGLVLGGGVPP